ncbi:hypothetical protein IFR05_006700 [Cadophora sp. M221]|nr:hypothetical protein IFR05_006700 [Cadophora sp. M221]
MLVPRLRAGWPLGRVLVVSFLRSQRSLPFAWTQGTRATTGESVATFCKREKLALRSEVIPGGSSSPPSALHFIRLSPGASKAKPTVLLYLHGGGYVNPVDIQGQLPFALDCAKSVGASDLAGLEYTLAPELKYPGQLEQAVEALRHLLATYSPDQIIIGGESAGGNLLLALLAHIKQPHPSVKALPPLPGKFAAAFAISPWVKATYNSRSFVDNSTYDYISAQGMENATKMWSPEFGEVWSEPIVGGVEFWQHVPVDHLLVTAGSFECFLDDVKEFGEQLNTSKTGEEHSVEFFTGEKEVHVQCALDKAVGIPYGYSASKILNWLETHVSNRQ